MKITRLYEIEADAFNDEIWSSLTFFVGRVDKKRVDSWLMDNTDFCEEDEEVHSGELDRIMSGDSKYYGLETCEEGEMI